MRIISVKAKSVFHGALSQSFRVPAKPGRYPRRCPSACDFAHDPKTGIQIHCGCGWPCVRTEWEVPDGYLVRAEWSDYLASPGRNNIVVVVEEDHHAND